MKEDSTRGAIASAFRSALRGLGDVDVVNAAEQPDFAITAVFVCTNLSPCLSFAGAIRIATPFNESAARVVFTHLKRTPTDSGVKQLESLLSGFEEVRKLFVVTWGQERFENAAKEFVGQIDSQCFEQSRQYARIATMPQAQHATAIARLEAVPYDC